MYILRETIFWEHASRGIYSRHDTSWEYMRPGREQLRRTFAETIRILRARVGLSQENLAHSATLDRGYMGLLERGRSTPTLETIFRLLAPLEIDFIQFATEFERVLQSRKRNKP